MDNKGFKISVVTVCYNVADTIEHTMLSVLGQTYPDVEYIVIDGGSDDGTADIIRKYANRLAYWVSEPDKGIYDAMNKGIAVATGDYINFMNAGDSFNSETTLSDFSKLIDTEKDIIYGDTVHVALSGEYKCKVYPLEQMSRRMPFGHQATFVKTSLMKEKKFDDTFRSSGDYQFLYNCYFEHRPFMYVPLTISKYDITKGMSLDNYRTVLKENGRIWGVDGTLSWKFVYAISVLKRDVKKMIKTVMPKKLLYFYQRRKNSQI